MSSPHLTLHEKFSCWWNNGKADHNLAIKTFNAIMDWDLETVEKCKKLGIQFDKKFWFTGRSEEIYDYYNVKERQEKLVGRIGNYPVYNYEYANVSHRMTSYGTENKQFLIITYEDGKFVTKFITEKSPNDIITFFTGSKTFNGKYTLQDVMDWKISTLPTVSKGDDKHIGDFDKNIFDL